jgi:hypothetical protein
MTIIGAAQEKKKLSAEWALDALIGEADHYQEWMLGTPEREIGDALYVMLDLIANSLNISVIGTQISESREAMRQWYWRTFGGQALPRRSINE